MENQDIKIVLDVETTGLDYRREKIIEFAAVKLVDGEIVAEYETLINPQQEIRRSSIEIHGITSEMVADAPTMDQVLPQILEFIGDYPIIGHNVIFDYSFINQACWNLYSKGIENHRIDTQHMFREVFPEEFSHGLEALLRRFKIESTTRHRAMADAKGLALAFPALKALYDQKYDWQMSQLKNINYLFERYLRIQQTVQTLQSELTDIKSVFKVYFEEGGLPVESSTGEMLNYQSKYVYNYNFEQLKLVLEEMGSYERVVKLNNGLIDRMIDSHNIDEDYRLRLSQARTTMGESRSVQISKPDRSFTVNNGN